jgi:hypothetical protein
MAWLRSAENRRTAEAKVRQRHLAVMSLSAAVVLIFWGVALLFIVTRPAAGVFCIAFGVCGLLLWTFLLPRYRREGFI